MPATSRMRVRLPRRPLGPCRVGTKLGRDADPARAPSFVGACSGAPPAVADQPSDAPSQPVAPVAPPGRRNAETAPRMPAAETQPKSAQPSPASPPPVAPAQPQRSFFGWVGFRLQPEPLASSQLPPPTFPASYQLTVPASQPNRVSPSPQGNPPADPPAPRFGGWKPVLLPALINKIKNWGNGCGCQGCHQKGPPSCCQACTCCGVKNSAVSASSQTNSAATSPSPAARTPNAASLVPSARSGGAEPGDVAEGRKVFEPTAIEGRDETPQS